MTTENASRKEVVTFLNTVTRPGCTVDGAGNDDHLVDAGIIDSFALIQVITWLEEEHGLALHELGMDPAELMSIGGILRALESRDA